MIDAILKLQALYYINLPEDEELVFLKERRMLEAMAIKVKKDYERILNPFTISVLLYMY